MASEHFMQQATDELNAGDLRQAAEKAWGAAAQLVKALANRASLPHRSNEHLDTAMLNFCDEVRVPHLHQQWESARRLHQHFYDGNLNLPQVSGHIDNVRTLCETIKRHLT